MFGLLKSFLPGSIWVTAGAVLIASTMSAWATYKVTSNSYEAAKTAAVEAALILERVNQKAARDASIKQAEIEANLRSVERAVTREVIRYVPDNRACDFGPDALRLLNAARRGELPAAAPSVPEPDTGDDTITG